MVKAVNPDSVEVEVDSSSLDNGGEGGLAYPRRSGEEDEPAPAPIVLPCQEFETGQKNVVNEVTVHVHRHLETVHIDSHARIPVSSRWRQAAPGLSRRRSTT